MTTGVGVRSATRRPLLALGLVAVLVVPTVLQMPDVADALRSLGLLHRRQAYVELFVSDPWTVTSPHVHSDQVDFAFVVRSHLPERSLLPWRVQTGPRLDDLGPPLLEGEVDLAPGAAVEQRVRLSLPCSTRTAVVTTVTRPDGSEGRLHFWFQPGTVEGRQVCVSP